MYYSEFTYKRVELGETGQTASATTATDATDAENTATDAENTATDALTPTTTPGKLELDSMRYACNCHPKTHVYEPKPKPKPHFALR